MKFDGFAYRVDVNVTLNGRELRFLYNIALASCKTCSRNAMPGGFLWLWVHQWAETHNLCPTLVFNGTDYDRKTAVCLATEQNLVSLIGMLENVCSQESERLSNMMQEMIKEIHKKTISLNNRESLR